MWRGEIDGRRDEIQAFEIDGRDEMHPEGHPLRHACIDGWREGWWRDAIDGWKHEISNVFICT